MVVDPTKKTEEQTGSEQKPTDVPGDGEQNESTDSSLADRIAALESRIDEGFGWLKGQFSTTTKPAAVQDSTSETSEETKEQDETVEVVVTDQKVTPRKGSRTQVNLSNLFR